VLLGCVSFSWRRLKGSLPGPIRALELTVGAALKDEMVSSA